MDKVSLLRSVHVVKGINPEISSAGNSFLAMGLVGQGQRVIEEPGDNLGLWIAQRSCSYRQRPFVKTRANMEGVESGSKIKALTSRSFPK